MQTEFSYHALPSSAIFVLQPILRPITRLRTKQEAQQMLTNPSDAFRGQSRSSNIVPIQPFHMLGIVSYCAIVTLSLSFFRYLTSKNVVTLKYGSEVTQGHRAFAWIGRCIEFSNDISAVLNGFKK